MYCFLHEFEHIDVKNEEKLVEEILTVEQAEILFNMVDKCEDYEFSESPDFDLCDYAFELEKCWKKADPLVCHTCIFFWFNKSTQFIPITASLSTLIANTIYFGSKKVVQNIEDCIQCTIMESFFLLIVFIVN